jgi:hypothetical protein
MLQGGADDEYYMCPVNFNVPDGSVYFIKSIGIRYKDYIANGQIIVYLKRINLYTGNVHTVVSWDSGLAAHSSTILTASKGTETGYKLVDSKKFVYWLSVYFYVDGDVTPGSDLTLFQVRIHYGT